MGTLQSSLLEKPAEVPTVPMWQQVVTLAWPVLIQQAIHYLVMLFDSWLAGNYRPLHGDHTATQAAQTTAFYLSWFISSFTVLVSVGSTALVARFIGAGDRREAKHVANQSLLLGGVWGIAGSIIGLLILPSLMHWLNLEGEAGAHAQDYLRPVFALLVFQVIETAGLACLNGVGDTRMSMWVLGTVGLVNVPLAWICSQGVPGVLPGLGFPGIALGTALSHCIGGLIVMEALRRGRGGLGLEWRLLHPDYPLLWRILRISIPASIDSVLATTGQLIFLSIVNGLGDDAVRAAHGMALRWEAISYMSGNAFGTAAMTLVGQYLGARRPDLAARGGWTAFGLASAVMSCTGVVFLIFAEPMFALFCPHPDQAPIIASGVPVLRLISLAMVPLACTIIFTASLRGAGDTRVPVAFSLVGFFVIRIPLAWYLTEVVHMGLMGAWLAMVTDLCLRGGIFLLRFASGRWKKIEV